MGRGREKKGGGGADKGGGWLAGRQRELTVHSTGRWVIEGLTRAPALVRLSYDNHLFPPDKRKGPSIIFLTAE